MYVDDDTRLRHMRDAAREALSFVAGRSRSDLDDDRMLYRAVVSCLGDIGEAASKLTPGAWNALPGVPWRQIVGMRNRLVHGYYEIDRDIVWETVTTHLPPLIAALRQVLADEGAEP
jgi:uncharacterized protein with HEPN domain